MKLNKALPLFSVVSILSRTLVLDSSSQPWDLSQTNPAKFLWTAPIGTNFGTLLRKPLGTLGFCCRMVEFQIDDRHTIHTEIRTFRAASLQLKQSWQFSGTLVELLDFQWPLRLGTWYTKWNHCKWHWWELLFHCEYLSVRMYTVS